MHTLDKRKAHYAKTCEWSGFVQVTGGGNCSASSTREAMDIGWMINHKINEDMPPSYTKSTGETTSEDFLMRISSKELMKLFPRKNIGKVITDQELQAVTE